MNREQRQTETSAKSTTIPCPSVLKQFNIQTKSLSNPFGKRLRSFEGMRPVSFSNRNAERRLLAKMFKLQKLVQNNFFPRASQTTKRAHFNQPLKSKICRSEEKLSYLVNKQLATCCILSHLQVHSAHSWTCHTPNTWARTLKSELACWLAGLAALTLTDWNREKQT